MSASPGVDVITPLTETEVQRMLVLSEQLETAGHAELDQGLA